MTRLREFRERIRRELPRDLTRGARVRRDREEGTATVDLGRAREADRIRLAEDIRHGRQLEHAVIEARTRGGWRTVTEVDTVGASRVLLLAAPVTARRWRLRVTRSRRTVRMAEFGLYRSDLHRSQV
ncbi:hypothetical protein ACOBQB_02805 [Streptomyces sp. G5(2025)]|uniref:hypothetical protein n=1 Tax=Streptomyces sp. G5(2025) TaxID=3406628 RepID=UPI003C27EE89